MPSFDEIRREPRFWARLRMPASFEAAERAISEAASGG
jgi:hypothetical protein